MIIYNNVPKVLCSISKDSWWPDLAAWPCKLETPKVTTQAVLKLKKKKKIAGVQFFSIRTKTMVSNFIHRGFCFSFIFSITSLS